MESMVADAAIIFLYLAPFLLLLSLCGFLADHVLPRCPRLLKFLERVLQVDLGGGEEWDQ
mgnify:CR=1 FL=1